MRLTAAICFALWMIGLCVLHTGQASPLVDNNATTWRERRASRDKCRFRCHSGECLDEGKYQCDGIKDCADGSDETAGVCQTMYCQDHLVRCDYGACVDADARCNGITNCADSSDEKNCEERKNKCVRGEFQCSTGVCIPSTEQCDGKLDCTDGSDETEAVCRNIPCPPYGFRCDYGACIDDSGFCNGVVQCADGSDEKPTVCGHPSASPPSPVVIASPTPKLTSSIGKPVAIPNDGRLCDPEENLPIPQHSDCGVFHVPIGVPFVRFGETAAREDFPWNAAVYLLEANGYKVICSGSLVSPRLVISAAHCFWNGSTNSLIPKENYKIALGKISAEWKEEDEHVKKFDVAHIVINCYYQHSQKYYDDDIAAVFLKGEVSFSKMIYPVCIDWEQKHHHGVKYGEVPGFGIDEHDMLSPVLRKVELPIVSIDICRTSFSSEFGTYLSNKKFCAGYQNGTTVCVGDSGGGFVFQSARDNLWYLRGIVSSGVRRDRYSQLCSKKDYSLFTNVYQFIPWLKRVYS